MTDLTYFLFKPLNIFSLNLNSKVVKLLQFFFITFLLVMTLSAIDESGLG